MNPNINWNQDEHVRFVKSCDIEKSDIAKHYSEKDKKNCRY